MDESPEGLNISFGQITRGNSKVSSRRNSKNTRNRMQRLISRQRSKAHHHRVTLVGTIYLLGGHCRHVHIGLVSSLISSYMLIWGDRIIRWPHAVYMKTGECFPGKVGCLIYDAYVRRWSKFI